MPKFLRLPVRFLLPLLAAAVLCQSSLALAADDESLAAHKVVIQVSVADPQVHQMALNNAANLQKALGPDNVDIEIVAYGPGLNIMTNRSPESSRIPSMAMQNIVFSACGNTMRNQAQRMGREPQLVEGVRVVPAGVVRIMELQEKGYTYIRP
ncbi:MAG: DsrE family protein [Chromatiales bacterium]|nr:DsrE family protein [Chromatiales bacterium]